MSIEFITDPQRTAYEAVAGMMREEFGRQAVADETRPLFWLRQGSAHVQVIVYPFGERAATVRVVSWVVVGAEQTPELHRFLLEQNTGMRFGAFGVDETGDVCFAHAVAADGLTHEALMFSVFAVAQTADDYDDVIVSRFGGQRSADR
jgi:hypothetical protein